jgi:excinuclease UvrABC nuclease subunit
MTPAPARRCSTRALISSLPHLPGVYRPQRQGDVLYVGKARPEKRVARISKDRRTRIELMLSQVAAVEKPRRRARGRALILKTI